MSSPYLLSNQTYSNLIPCSFQIQTLYNTNSKQEENVTVSHILPGHPRIYWVKGTTPPPPRHPPPSPSQTPPPTPPPPTPPPTLPGLLRPTSDKGLFIYMSVRHGRTYSNTPPYNSTSASDQGSHSPHGNVHETGSLNT